MFDALLNCFYFARGQGKRRFHDAPFREGRSELAGSSLPRILVRQAAGSVALGRKERVGWLLASLWKRPYELSGACQRLVCRPLLHPLFFVDSKISTAQLRVLVSLSPSLRTSETTLFLRLVLSICTYFFVFLSCIYSFVLSIFSRSIPPSPPSLDPLPRPLNSPPGTQLSLPTRSDQTILVATEWFAQITVVSYAHDTSKNTSPFPNRPQNRPAQRP